MTVYISEICQTLENAMGSGGGNIPMVVVEDEEMLCDKRLRKQRDEIGEPALRDLRSANEQNA